MNFIFGIKPKKVTQYDLFNSLDIMFLFHDYPLGPFRFGELYLVRDLIISDKEEDLKKAYNKLVALNYKKALPKHISTTKDIIEAIFAKERQKTIDIIHNSIPSLVTKFWEDNAEISEEIKTNKHKADLNLLNDDQLHSLLLALFNFFKDHYWKVIEPNMQARKEKLIDMFKNYAIHRDSVIFEQPLVSICSVLLPDLIHSFITEEKPYGIQFTNRTEKNTNKFFSYLLKQDPTISQTISLLILDDKKQYGDNLQFLERFLTTFGQTIHFKEPAHYGDSSLWPPVPIGEVYGKNTTDLTMSEDMFCEVYFKPQKPTPKVRQNEQSNAVLKFDIPVFAPQNATTKPEVQIDVAKIVVQKPVKGKSLFDKK